MKILSVLIVSLVFVASAASAQSPYAGMQSRPIKSLSADQVADLKAARGMGLALAAELNGYPGPAHVLELADKLDLTSAQRDQVQRLFDSMKAEATPIGARLIEQEGALDHQFADRTISADELKRATARIGATQAELRNAHLKYHLATAQILSPHQLHQYAMLRGYAAGDMPSDHHRHHGE
jgi:Spy/CpxP family protein refolding chaperone